MGRATPAKRLLRRLAALPLAAALALAAPGLRPAHGQDGLPLLVADQIYINADQTLTAEGNIEILFGTQRVTASRIVYDQVGDRLLIEGPIVIDDGQGMVFLADQADMSADLQEGILRSARVVLQDQLQIAAHEIDRVSGRYTQLNRVTASTCQVCASHPVPLWEIRAARVVHDQEERQLYYDNATFRVAGIPVFYIPRLRMPDPSVDRASGFLLPQLFSSSQLGLGVELPYFFAIDDSRDVTMQPLVFDTGGVTVGARYRQAFTNGALEFNLAVSSDDIVPDALRGYIFGDGRFTLADGTLAGFDLQLASDDTYLLDYGISDIDRLASDIFRTRVGADTFFDQRLTFYRSLRDNDINAYLPSIVANTAWSRRIAPSVLGGQATLWYDLGGLVRTSHDPYDTTGDGVADGRDVVRAALGGEWRRQSVLDNGMIFAASAAVTAAAYGIDQDVTFPGFAARVTPFASAELRWPWVRAAADGSSQVIEPIAQIVWSPESGTDVPNEDSVLVEFDEGNLFSFSRYPGIDDYEAGLRANLGLGWTLSTAGGWTLGVTGGRVLRADDLNQFSTGSGLDGSASNWLLTLRAHDSQGFAVINRGLFDDQGSFTKDSFRMQMGGENYWMAGNYVWLVPDPSEDRPNATSQLGLDGGWQFATGWTLVGNGIYDFELNRTALAGLGLQFRSECAQIDLSLSRRYISSTSVDPTTEFNLSVNLNGYGTGSDGRQYRKVCSG